MTWIRAPRHLKAAVCDELIDRRMALRSAVIVPVTPQRRNQHGWPAVIFAARVIGRDILEGVPAVWATSEYGGPVLAVDGAAREFSIWAKSGPSLIDASPAMESLGHYPEVAEARRGLAMIEEKDSAMRRGIPRF